MDVVTGSALEAIMQDVVSSNRAIEQGITTLIVVILCIFVIWFLFNDEK